MRRSYVVALCCLSKIHCVGVMVTWLTPFDRVSSLSARPVCESWVAFQPPCSAWIESVSLTRASRRGKGAGANAVRQTTAAMANETRRTRDMGPLWERCLPFLLEDRQVAPGGDVLERGRALVGVGLDPGE